MPHPRTLPLYVGEVDRRNTKRLITILHFVYYVPNEVGFWGLDRVWV